jgi:hypothetical protein
MRRSGVSIIISLIALTLAFALGHTTAGGASHPKGSTPPTTAGGAVSSHVVGGVPVGYARNESGAAAAAAAYLAALGSPAMFRPAARRGIIATVTGPEATNALVAGLNTDYELTGRALDLDSGTGAPPPGGTLVARATPMGFTVVAYRADQAVVAVWQNAIVGIAGPGAREPVREYWSTETVTLRWVSGDWRWLSLSSEEGPAPIGPLLRPAPARQLANQFLNFTGYDHVAR